jgi:hypothetical protein
VAVAAKSLLDHRLGGGDFGGEGDHLQGQPGHRGGGQILSGQHRVLGMGGFERSGRDRISVAGLAFPQPRDQAGRARAT